MDPAILFQHLALQLGRKPITFTRLAANSLLLYVGGKPGDKCGHVLWFEPTWHCLSPSRVITGSRQAQVEDNKEHEALADVLGAALTDRMIRSISKQQVTNDLHLELEDDYWVKTFASDPTDDHSWHIKDYESGLSLYGCPSDLRIEQSLPRD